MNDIGFLSLLGRHLPTPLTWDDLVVGFDLGLLEPAEIVRWSRTHPPTSEAARDLAAQDTDSNLFDVVPLLWAACREDTGKVPRHGTERWIKAQDRWRVALLRDALDTTCTPESLAAAVQVIFDLLGSPQDMWGLWTQIRTRAYSLPQSAWNVLGDHIRSIEARWDDPQMLQVS